MPKTPPQSQFGEIYLPTSKIKPVRVNLAFFWRLRRKFAQKLIFPKKSSTEGQLRRILGEKHAQKGPPSEHRTQIYLPTSGMGSCTFFLHPACIETKNGDGSRSVVALLLVGIIISTPRAACVPPRARAPQRSALECPAAAETRTQRPEPAGPAPGNTP